MAHLDRTLQSLQEHQLNANKSKCSFGMREIEYLGHVISKNEVKVDPHKIVDMQDWVIPKSKITQGIARISRPKKLLSKICKELWEYCSSTHIVTKKRCL